LKIDEGLATLIRRDLRLYVFKRQLIYFWIIEFE